MRHFNPKRQIAIIWSVEDVLALREDLTEDQAFKVLQSVELHHDATIGINWDTLEYHADILYPRNEE